MADEHLEGLLQRDPGAGETRVEDLAPYGGRCYWCLALPDHQPAKCGRREKPDMSDFDQRKPRRKRKSRSGPKAQASGKSRAQTTRSAEEQEQHQRLEIA